MKVNLGDFISAKQEGEITVDWFTDKLVMLDDMAELGFDIESIGKLQRELNLLRSFLFPTEEELHNSWISISGLNSPGEIKGINITTVLIPNEIES